MVYQTTVTEKHQITIPKKLREVYGVRKGTKVSLIPLETGIEILATKRVKNIAQKLYGIAKFKKDAVNAVNEFRGAKR